MVVTFESICRRGSERKYHGDARSRGGSDQDHSYDGDDSAEYSSLVDRFLQRRREGGGYSQRCFEAGG